MITRFCSLPLANVVSYCLDFQRHPRFEARANNQELHGRLLRCACGLVPGR